MFIFYLMTLVMGRTFNIVLVVVSPPSSGMIMTALIDDDLHHHVYQSNDPVSPPKNTEKRTHVSPFSRSVFTCVQKRTSDNVLVNIEKD